MHSKLPARIRLVLRTRTLLRVPTLLLAAALLLGSPAFAAGAAQEIPGPLAMVSLQTAGVTFQTGPFPGVDFGDYTLAGYTLSVRTPEGSVLERSFDSGTPPRILLHELGEELGEEVADGIYTYQMRAALHREEALTRQEAARLPRLPTLPTLSGTFRVLDGAIFLGEATEGAEEAATGPSSGGPAGGLQALPAADQIILDDLIVDGNQCVGFSCVNGEAFGSDVLRLKDVNNRLHFLDTSAGAFPSNDWRITLNSDGSGGANYFAIEDDTANRNLFTLEAGAPVHSLYLDNLGRLGMGTATPADELHLQFGDTPSIRLEQTSGGGFTAQTWRIGGNESNFFVEDVSAGPNVYPFRVRPGAPTSSIDISGDGDVGVGTASPDERIHVFENVNANTFILVQNTNSGANAAGVLRARSDEATVNFQAHAGGRNLVRFGETIGGWAELLQVDGNGLMIGTVGMQPLILGTDGNNVLEITPDGDVLFQGTAVHSDYVFEADYPLPTIRENTAFIRTHKHLMAIGPARYSEDGREVLTLGRDRQAIVEELEKAHIYIAQLHGRLELEAAARRELLERLERLEQLETRIDALLEER